MEKEPNYFLHTVQNYDTLAGLSLDYRVSVYDLKRLNHLSSDQILFLKEIKIPKHKNSEAVKADGKKNQEEEKEVNLNALQFKFHDVKSQVIKKYLEESNQDYEKTSEKLREDHQQILGLQNLMARFKKDFPGVKQVYLQSKKDLDKTKERLKKEFEEIPLKSDLKGKLKAE